MRANHIPRADRLRERIFKLSLRYDEGHVPIGGGNPYWKCADCGVSDPAESFEGHRRGCQRAGIPKQIEHYKRLLAEELGHA